MGYLIALIISFFIPLKRAYKKNGKIVIIDVDPRGSSFIKKKTMILILKQMKI